MTRWTAADVQRSNARARKAKALRVTQEDFDKLEAIQQDVERIGKSDRARRKRLGIGEPMLIKAYPCETVHLPIETHGETNKREHWAKLQRRRNDQRAFTKYGLQQVMGPSAGIMAPGPGLRIILTRIAPRKITDDDNLVSAFKAVRDGVADWLHVDDGDPHITWEYGQRKGKPREYAVRVTFVYPRGNQKDESC